MHCVSLYNSFLFTFHGKFNGNYISGKLLIFIFIFRGIFFYLGLLNGEEVEVRMVGRYEGAFGQSLWWHWWGISNLMWQIKCLWSDWVRKLLALLTPHLPIQRRQSLLFSMNTFLISNHLSYAVDMYRFFFYYVCIII